MAEETKQGSVDANKITSHDTFFEYKNTKGQRCVGCDLNCKIEGNIQNPQIDLNRVVNPNPPIGLNGKSMPLAWDVEEGTPVLDGCGVLMGKVHGTYGYLSAGDFRKNAVMFNFGMTKKINNKLHGYAFAVWCEPIDKNFKKVNDEAIKLRKLDAKESKQQQLGKLGYIHTSAWVPLDNVKDREILLEKIGLGKGKKPVLPLAEKAYIITGGNPEEFMTEDGHELRIVDNLKIPATATHYLTRPSGTINIIYCVPGFGLGGQAVDSVLVANQPKFRSVLGVKQFVMPTYFPPKHPQSGEITGKYMTFVYGAVDAENTESVYGWVAAEALKNFVIQAQ